MTFVFRSSLLAGCAILAASVPLSAQDSPVERVRALYASAAYEDALAAMPAPGEGARASTDLESYRALCLLALGREEQAAAAVERLVRDHPEFVASPTDTSPRMQALFTAARARVLPGLAKEEYAAARKAFEAKDLAMAGDGFRRTLELIRATPEEQRAGLADLEVLAAGFLDLAAVKNTPRPVPAVEPLAVETPQTTPPVPVKQDMPGWTTPAGMVAGQEFVGIIRVDIGADGRVQSATVVKPSHPSYDAAVLRAATGWIYKPGTVGGRPVPSQKTIEIRLRPQ